MEREWTMILQIALLVTAIFTAFGLYILYEKRKKKRMLLAKIRADWGAWPEREYEPNDWKVAEGYYANRKCEGFQIDDITWEDLDLARVFMLLNHTGSYLGEGYLYYLLRTPDFFEEKLEERESLICVFSEHEAEREQMQELFWETGKSGRNSIYDAVYNLADANPGSAAHHILMAGLVVASIGSLFVAPRPGILILIAAMYVSMLDYYRKKRPIEHFAISCGFLLKTLDMGEKLCSLDIPQITKQQAEIRHACQAFGKLRRNSFFLIAGSNTAGDLLTGIIMYLNSCFHIDLIQFSRVVREMKKHLKEFESIVGAAGEIEAAIAIASFRACMESWCVPELHFAPERQGRQEEKSAGQTQELQAKRLYHPLIQEPVKNDISTERGVLLTGSNASGKSTFLKTVAINALLAQTVHTCMADRWESGCFRVYSSMALRDNLENRESYYMVEIRSLKRIMDEIVRDASRPPVLCFADEVLRGTNTVERIAASAQVLKHMTGAGVLCFAATHDIELTRILEHYYDNYHFQEEVVGNDIHFNYLLYPGRAVSRNAIRLLQIMGYDEEVIRQAQQAAQEFADSGEWSVQE